MTGIKIATTLMAASSAGTIAADIIVPKDFDGLSPVAIMGFLFFCSILLAAYFIRTLGVAIGKSVAKQERLCTLLEGRECLLDTDEKKVARKTAAEIMADAREQARKIVESAHDQRGRF